MVLGRVKLPKRRSSTSLIQLGVRLIKPILRCHNLPFPDLGIDSTTLRLANHKAIFSNVGCTTVEYPYYDPATIGLGLTAYLSFLRSAPPQSVILLHACAHNPTGVDPTRAQWTEIAQIFVERGHFAFFDSAYQGFASGDLENDAWAVRHFVEAKIPLLVCQSFAKNAGLYGERVGALNVVARIEGEGEGGSKRIESQLNLLQRSEISNPPTYGARIVSPLSLLPLSSF